MADDNPTTLPVQSGILDPLVGAGFFSSNMSLEEIKRRRAIAAALASRARPFPKTIGEGMTYFGESLAEAFQDRKLAEAEKGYNERFDKEAGPLRARIGVDTEAPPVVTPPPAAAAPRADVVAPAGRPSPLPPAPAGPMAGAAPAANRDDITRAIAMRNPALADMIAQVGGRGAPPPNPMVTANASLASPTPSPTVGAATGAVPDGATFAEEGGPNPPTITNTIRPMQMAQAGPPAAPVQPTATPGGTLAPVIPESLPDRPAPVLNENMTKTEKDAWLFWQRTRDPRAEDMFRQAHELGKATRKAAYDREKTDYDKYMAQKIARDTLIENARINAPRMQQELGKGAAELTAAQDAERARIFHGNLPAPVAKALEESKEKATLSTGAIEAVANAREAQKYAVSGLGADAKLLYYRAKAQTGDKEAQRIVQASETYKANLVPIMQTMLKSLAGKDISTKELEFIRSVSGADLSLDKDSADRMLAIAERVARQDVTNHRDTIETMIKGQREEALPALRKLYDVREPMSGVPLSDTSATSGGYKEGDIARGRPGQPDLVRRGGKWVPM